MRGRKPIKDLPQKDLPPQERNSRAYSFRINRDSGDVNDVKLRAICDRWIDNGIFTEMIKKGIFLADGTEPITNQELSRVLLTIGRDLRDIKNEEEEHLESIKQIKQELMQIIHQLQTNTPTIAQDIKSMAANDFPDGFIDNLLNNFDE